MQAHPSDVQPARDYHHMSVAQKQAHQRERMREAAVACPTCEVQTTVADLLAHVETRCSGVAPAPHPNSAWVTWAEALELGAARGTLSRWVAAGRVRSRGTIQERRYLLRDLTRCLAAQRSRRR